MTRSRLLTPALAAAALIALIALGVLALSARSDEGVEAPGRKAPVAAARSFDLKVVARGLLRPTTVLAAPGDSDAIWATEQTGRVVRLEGERRTTELDLRGQISVGAERGLLGLAFHPDFARNRRFVVNFTDPRGDTRVQEFKRGKHGRATLVRELLTVAQPEENHNGGALVFAMDGALLVGMGDGGGAFDPDSRAQDPEQRLGKVLRADIDAPGAIRWTTLLSGMRNPWRMWMDPALNELWIGDVGQDHVEEINRVLYEPDESPKNMGWPAWEGDRLLDRDRIADDEQPVHPVAVYGHDEGCSVTGGLMYRGRTVEALRERYVYGDFCTGTVWSLRPGPALTVSDIRREAARVPQLTSIGTDADGELVFATASGDVLRAVPG